MEDPLFSIIVLSYDASHLLALTLDNVIDLPFEGYEVIVVDHGAKEHTLQVLKSYEGRLKQVLHTKEKNISSMMNKGISLSKGKYLHFLKAGDRYIARRALTFIKEQIEKNENPDLIYGGYLKVEEGKLPEAIIEPLTLSSLWKGKWFIYLRSCWFSKEFVVKSGGVDNRYHYRSGYELICRIFKQKGAKIVFCKRIFADGEPLQLPARTFLRLAWESFTVVYRHFGIGKALVWWLIQDPLRILKWSYRSVKQAFWKT